MAEDALTVAELDKFMARVDEQFDYVNQWFDSLEAAMAEFRAELRSQRVLMWVLHGPVAVGAALAIVGVAAKFVFS